MQYTKKRLLSIIIIILIVCSTIVSCGDSSGNSQSSVQTTENGESGTNIDAPVVEEYVYPEMDGGGADFKILNIPADTWFFYTDLVHEEMTGDALDDAVYTRNRIVEEKFNINIREINNKDMWTHNGDIRRIVMSGMDEYDAIFCTASFNGTVGAMIAERLFYDLREIPTMNLDGEWWNQTMLREAAIGTGKSIFYTGSGINLMAAQAVACVYFNQDMMTNLGLALPYNIVKEGKWTYDVFQEYLRDGTQLNDASDFKWNQSGNAIYGLVSYENSVTALLAGSGETFVVSGANGTPELAIGRERFINALTRISDILNMQNGNYLYANTQDNGFHYEQIFKNGRALMAIGELKAANVFRDMEATFGILPIPKYEESQPAYYSHLFIYTPVLTIPVTNPRPEFTGAVLDAMAYLSNKDVIPVLFDISVSQKQLRNEESIEMLRLIKNSGSFEISMAYGWTNTFYDLVRSRIGEKGQPMNIASETEKYTNAINKSIEKTMDLFDQ